MRYCMQYMRAPKQGLAECNYETHTDLFSPSKPQHPSLPISLFHLPHFSLLCGFPQSVSTTLSPPPTPHPPLATAAQHSSQ